MSTIYKERCLNVRFLRTKEYQRDLAIKSSLQKSLDVLNRLTKEVQKASLAK